ncbi:MAG: outer membrane protein assembly factor BamB [Gallionellales bacterium 35-53-114]|nr:MAG: outer membrane protein assembly factor BamB [Gallionellales bacterium 35-53-114]OYZ64674.1 MAG: outer membrane protein assembly factor BamB [Gallionellales bacterium 24-53-125]OZB07787.1 MAG: outer membrane protein assembly factor BamB [Gallionellales bacterium 39-52-133]HQS58499.1 outer membrane protein assembly factor BamB [Gallionellaceae bacterium]HQS74840.1 outer membrane protein assembly factor BamB [Gallionellaceae bacterium]
MRLARSTAALILAVLLSGCFGGKLGGREPAELREFKPAAKLEVRWKRNVGEVGNAGLQPAVTPDGVYVANADGELFRLDPVSGKKIWKIDIGFKISGAVGAGEDLVVVGGLKSELVAFNADGKVRWASKVSSEVLSAPQIVNGMVVVRTSDGRIAALSALDGKRQWLYERATPTLIVRNHAGVVVQNGIVFAGFAAGKLAAISLANGAVIWESAVSQPRGNTELERISDITSLPAVDNNSVCAVAFQGRIACFDIKQGAMLWSRDVSSDKGLALKHNYLYVSDAEGTVMALDKSSGSTLWKNDQLFMRQVAAPFLMDKYVLVGDFEGYLHALSREDGSLLARIKTDGSPILFAPVLLGKGFLLQTQDGGVYSIEIN